MSIGWQQHAPGAKHSMQHYWSLFLSIFFLTSCGNNLPLDAPTPVRPTFEISTAKPTDRIAYSAQNNRVLFDVVSEGGIGSARIAQTGGAVPQNMILNLHLSALEHFKFSFDDQFVEIEIPTTGSDHTPRESVSADSPLYMPVKIVSRDNAYPIREGFIQIELPRAYHDAGAREFSIEWIDFYR